MVRRGNINFLARPRCGPLCASSRANTKGYQCFSLCHKLHTARCGDYCTRHTTTMLGSIKLICNIICTALYGHQYTRSLQRRAAREPHWRLEWRKGQGNRERWMDGWRVPSAYDEQLLGPTIMGTECLELLFCCSYANPSCGCGLTMADGLRRAKSTLCMGEQARRTQMCR